MPVNLQPFAKSMFGPQAPFRLLLPVAAGSGQAIKRGEICEISSSVWAPISSDASFTAELAVCDHEIVAESKAGYYPFIIPRPGDMFEFELAAAAAAARGADLYYSTSQVLTTSGNNSLGDVVDHSGIPRQQGKADVGDVADRTSTILSAGFVLMTFKASTSYYAALQT